MFLFSSDNSLSVGVCGWITNCMIWKFMCLPYCICWTRYVSVYVILTTYCFTNYIILLTQAEPFEHQISIRCVCCLHTHTHANNSPSYPIQSHNCFIIFWREEDYWVIITFHKFRINRKFLSELSVLECHLAFYHPL